MLHNYTVYKPCSCIHSISLLNLPDFLLNSWQLFPHLDRNYFLAYYGLKCQKVTTIQDKNQDTEHYKSQNYSLR